MDILNVSFDLINGSTQGIAHSLTDEVIVSENDFLSGQQVLNNGTMPAVRLEALTFFLCKYGEISFSIDYKDVRLTKGAILYLSNIHILDHINIGKNYKGYTLILSQKIVQSIISEMPNVSQMMMQGDRLSPLCQLEEDEMRLLTDIIIRIKDKLKATNHVFRSQIVKNEVSNFIFELADITLKRLDIEANGNNKSHKEEITQKFFQLIFSHCKEQHEVAFYAKELHMTPGNLSRITKETSGKAANSLINAALITEAKILLRKPDVNIQLVSEELHFGDQSTFGKFFKKHTGYTPMEYRNKV